MENVSLTVDLLHFLIVFVKQWFHQELQSQTIESTPTLSTCYSDVIIIRRSLLKTCECWALTRPPPPQQRKNFSTASQETKQTPIVNIALSNQTLFSISIHLEPANTPSFFPIHFCWGAKTFQYPANKLSFYANGVSPLPPAKLTWQQSHRWVGEPLHDRSSIQVFCDERMVAKAEKNINILTSLWKHNLGLCRRQKTTCHASFTALIGCFSLGVE